MEIILLLLEISTNFKPPESCCPVPTRILLLLYTELEQNDKKNDYIFHNVNYKVSRGRFEQCQDSCGAIYARKDREAFFIIPVNQQNKRNKRWLEERLVTINETEKYLGFVKRSGKASLGSVPFSRGEAFENSALSCQTRPIDVSATILIRMIITDYLFFFLSFFFRAFLSRGICLSNLKHVLHTTHLYVDRTLAISQLRSPKLGRILLQPLTALRQMPRLKKVLKKREKNSPINLRSRSLPSSPSNVHRSLPF
uniref:Uncharacterized protein n=1 Tax=Heterorhabditis bacteriophora TaxID=37862 RepID=A0A1I7WAG1_HETBA